MMHLKPANILESWCHVSILSCLPPQNSTTPCNHQPRAMGSPQVLQVVCKKKKIQLQWHWKNKQCMQEKVKNTPAASYIGAL